MADRSNHRFEFGSVCLQAVGVTASWRRLKKDSQERSDYTMVVIQSASTADDGVYFPPSEVTVTGKEGLLALREAIDQALLYSDKT